MTIAIENRALPRLGWVGTGRMGLAMADRLLSAGHPLRVWNRTAVKALPLAERGAVLAKDLVELGACDIVFMMVSTHHEVETLLFGEAGLLSGNSRPRIIIDSSSIGSEASHSIRAQLEKIGVAFLAAPVSGNARVIRAGKLSMVISGPQKAFDESQPYLSAIGSGLTYIGEGDLARIAKICHNLMLGVVTQNLAEILVLAEKSGLRRCDFLAFLNASVMGSMFTRYKTPALVNLDFEVTFTPELMLKDLDLGLAAASQLGVPMPTTRATRDQLKALVDGGCNEDFSQLLLLQAEASGLKLSSDYADIDDGLT